MTKGTEATKVTGVTKGTDLTKITQVPRDLHSGGVLCQWTQAPMNRNESRLTAAMAAASLAFLGVLLNGCQGVEQPGERLARGNLKAVEQAYWPAAALPPLDAEAGLSNYLQYRNSDPTASAGGVL